MRISGADTESGSRAEGHERLASGWEWEWREAAAIERGELGRPRGRPTRWTWAGVGATAVVGALLPAILPLSPGYPESATTAQVVAAAVAAIAAISIVPASMLAGEGWTGRWSVGRLLLCAVALASAGAAAIHFAVVKDHLEEYTLFGVFFVGSGLAQLAWAMWAAIRPSRALLGLGAAGNALIALLWAVDRVWGVPIGPEHWKPEPIGFGDAVASGLELFIAGGCLTLLARGPGRVRSEVRPAALVLAVLVLVLTTLGLLSVLGVASSILTPSA